MEMTAEFNVEPSRELVGRCWDQQDMGPDPSSKKHEQNLKVGTNDDDYDIVNARLKYDNGDLGGYADSWVETRN